MAGLLQGEEILQKISTGQGHVYFTSRGYEYQTHMTYQSGHRYLMCTYNVCKMNLTIDLDNRVLRGELGPHLHEVENYKRDQRLIISRIYDRVVTETTDFLVIFTEETRGYPAQVTATLNQTTVLEKCRRWRRASYPPLPKTLREFGECLEVEEYRNLGLSHDGSPLYRKIVGNHAVLFVSESMKSLLQTPDVVLNCDATFKAVPHIPEAKQMLTIMAPYTGVALPVVWAVMRTKNRSCYRDILIAVKNLVPEMSPKGVILDFELALHRAFVDVFPNIHIYGCWFHYIQALCRNRSRFGLSRHLLDTNEHLMEIFRMAKALPFLKAEDIPLGIMVLEERASVHTDAQSFVQYLKDTWEPKAIQLSVYRRSRRTNNEIEVYHRNIMAHMRGSRRGGNRPPTWIFMAGLQGIEQCAEQKYNNLLSGVTTPARQRNSLRDHNRQIQLMFQQYDEGERSITEVLTWMGHHSKDVGLDEQPNNAQEEEDQQNPEDLNDAFEEIEINIDYNWDDDVDQLEVGEPTVAEQPFSRGRGRGQRRGSGHSRGHRGRGGGSQEHEHSEESGRGRGRGRGRPRGSTTRGRTSRSRGGIAGSTEFDDVQARGRGSRGRRGRGGRGRGVAFIVDVLPNSSEHLSAVSEHLPAVSEHLPAASQHLLAVSEHLPAASQHLPAASQHLPAASQHNDQESEDEEMDSDFDTPEVVYGLGQDPEMEAFEQAEAEALRTVEIFETVPSPSQLPIPPTNDHCVICMDVPKCVLVLPCRHLVCCEACESLINQCPVCRTPITNKMQVFT